MIALFLRIYRYFSKRKPQFYALLIVVFSILIYGASRIGFEEDISKLIPSGEDSEQITQVLRNTNFADKIILNISSEKTGNTEQLRNYADEISDSLANHSAYLKNIRSKFEDEQIFELFDFVSIHLPLYLNESDYDQIDSLLQPESIEEKVAETYRSVVSPSGMVTTQMLRADPLGFSFLALDKFKQLQAGDNFILQDGYLIHQNGKNLLVFLEPSAAPNETAQNTELVETLDQLIHFLNSKYKKDGVQAEYFGATPVSVANAKQIKRDIILTLSISLVLLFALFIYFYRKVHIPLIILVPALFGSLLGIVVLYFLKGTISAISIGIGSVLLGLTLDYSLHILSHYRNTGDVKKLFKSTVKPLVVCAVFTAADFLCLLFLHSDVLKDLGVFAAVSVLGAAFFALVFIPQVYSPGKPLASPEHTFLDRLAEYDFSKNKWLLGISVLLIGISLFTYHRVGFENDLNKLNFLPEHLEKAQNHLDELDNYASKSVYLAAYGQGFEEAAKVNSALFDSLKILESKKEIIAFNSIGEVLISARTQKEKIDRWNLFWTAEKKELLRNRLISEGKKYGFKENTFQPFFEKMNQTHSIEKLHENPLLRDLFLNEFVSTENGLTTITSVIKTDQPDTASLIEKLAQHENVLVIDRKHLQETFLSNLEADFDKLFFISSIVIFLVLLLFFRSVELTLITNIPIFVGWLATLGMMGLFGLDFNAFNIIITTLIFGLGVDYSIFITRGLMEKYTYGRDEMPAFRSGILLSAIATIVCFGVLVFAEHPAIYSISWIPIIGLTVVVLMSFTIQAWLFHFFIQKPQDKGNTPRTVFNILLTIGTFGYFFIGGLMLNLMTQILVPLIPLSKERKLAFFHHTLQLFFKKLMFGTPFVKIKIIGKEHLQLNRPQIIIANHTSQLDTPTVGMIHPKAIFMVNNRVLRSKFFGKAIQMAGFYSVSNHYEDSLEELKEKVHQGYSLIVFPEGTRSTTSVIQRFHKGAFYWAQELNLAILPVLIRGNSDLLPKNDNLLKTGKLTLEFLPPIQPDDERFGQNYSERTKKISTYFKQKFLELKRADEGEDYFKNKLKFNYIYKPRVIQKTFWSDFESNKKAYHEILHLVPPKAKVFHGGCGYGVLGFLLVYDSALRNVLAWDADSEKVKAAQNTFTTNRFPIHFTDVLPDIYEVFDYLILPPEGFEKMINLENWELVFSKNNLNVYKNTDGRRI
ncbi:MAG: 1-acyl-sn-glycerol-3-phosphate acyltransferase [Moheibacter sp.]